MKFIRVFGLLGLCLWPFAGFAAELEVTLTVVPAHGSRSPLQGRLLNGNPDDYRVVVFVWVHGSGWWLKPSCADSSRNTVAISPENTWTTDISTTDLDDAASQIFVGLLPSGYFVPCVRGADALPSDVLTSLLASASAARSNADERRLMFSGYEWVVKTSRVPVGPGGNLFSDGLQNVWVDSQGRLHLRITNRDGVWYCAEIAAVQAFGYGSYRFYIDSSVSDLDANIAFGLFTWSEEAAQHHQELDIEFSKWGQAANASNSQFVVQPFGDPRNIRRFQMPTDIETSVHTFQWREDAVLFESLSTQDIASASAANTIAKWEFSDALRVPRESGARPRLNLWLVGSPPANRAEAEVIISRFEHIPDKVTSSTWFVPGSIPDAAGVAGGEQTGMVLANSGNTVSNARVTAYDKVGAPSAGPGIANPGTLSLRVGEQRSLLLRELLGNAASSNGPGWLKVETSTDSTNGLALAFSTAQERLEYLPFIKSPLADFIVAHVDNAHQPRLLLTNPLPVRTIATLDLLDQLGRMRASANIQLLENASLIAEIRDLFPTVTVASSDYVRGRSQTPILAMEYWGTRSDISTLAGLDPRGASRSFIAPFALPLESGWKSSITLINGGTREAAAELRLVDGQGSSLATRNLQIAPGGKFTFEGLASLGGGAGAGGQGYIKIESTADLVGFFSLELLSTSASTAGPLLSRVQQSALLIQVLSDSEYFTGLTIINPTNSSARFTVDLLDKDGNMIRSLSATISGGERRSRLLSEFFPDLSEARLAPGYFRIASKAEFVHFGLIGKRSLSAISSISAAP